MRNFAPVAPFAVRWQIPFDAACERSRPRQIETGRRTQANHLPADLLALLPPGGLENKEWLAVADEDGISRRTFFRLRAELKKAGKILESVTSGKWQPILNK